jgi:hypothetical protein
MRNGVEYLGSFDDDITGEEYLGDETAREEKRVVDILVLSFIFSTSARWNRSMRANAAVSAAT